MRAATMYFLHDGLQRFPTVYTHWNRSMVTNTDNSVCSSMSVLYGMPIVYKWTQHQRYLLSHWHSVARHVPNKEREELVRADDTRVRLVDMCREVSKKRQLIFRVLALLKYTWCDTTRTHALLHSTTVWLRFCPSDWQHLWATGMSEPEIWLSASLQKSIYLIVVMSGLILKSPGLEMLVIHIAVLIWVMTPFSTHDSTNFLHEEGVVLPLSQIRKMCPYVELLVLMWCEREASRTNTLVRIVLSVVCISCKTYPTNTSITRANLTSVTHIPGECTKYGWYADKSWFKTKHATQYYSTSMMGTINERDDLKRAHLGPAVVEKRS